jgi:type I restriction enzyme S subunit
MRNVPRRRLAGFSGAWVEKRLGECGSFSKGAGISRAQANSGRIPAVRYGELYTTHHEYIKAFESFISDDVARCSTRLTRGDIVFACSGETKEEIGKCAAFLGDEIAYAGGDLLILSPKESYDSKFLAFELNTPFCASQKAAAGQGDAVVHIRQHSLEELIVCIPPTLAEQKAIAAVLSDIDAEIAALEAKRAKYESIKQGMMQELLTGKTRLSGK